MAKYKFKFLVVQTNIPELTGMQQIVAQLNVSSMDKYSVGKEWGKLEDKYPKTHYVTFLSETNENRREFQEEPKLK